MTTIDSSLLNQPLAWVNQRENALLAPFAMRSADSKGRLHPEPEHPYRGRFNGIAIEFFTARLIVV